MKLRDERIDERRDERRDKKASKIPRNKAV
jgi:hypothetical protein